MSHLAMFQTAISSSGETGCERSCAWSRCCGFRSCKTWLYRPYIELSNWRLRWPTGDDLYGHTMQVHIRPLGVAYQWFIWFIYGRNETKMTSLWVHVTLLDLRQLVLTAIKQHSRLAVVALTESIIFVVHDDRPTSRGPHVCFALGDCFKIPVLLNFFLNFVYLTVRLVSRARPWPVVIGFRA